MKDAELWIIELDANETGVAICTASEIKQIQEDAYKAAIEASKFKIKLAFAEFRKTKVTPYAVALQLHEEILLNSL